VLPDDESVPATIASDDATPLNVEPAADPVSVLAPATQTVPLIFASPHSGADYPAEFVAGARLDPLTLRRSEDAFVDEIFAAAPDHGAPLLRAHFPRAYVDPNRERYELDPRMFAGALPSYVNTASPRVAAGLGTIARVVTSGDDIYRDKLTFAEAKQRIDMCYGPYHDTLGGLIEATRSHFGVCLLIDCHSMPSVGGPMDRDPGLKRVNMVLGDGHGSTCAKAVVDLAEATLDDLGFVVTRNNPYAGGFTTRHYGRPETGVHTLQIEINRALYMDEAAVSRGAGLPALAANMERLIAILADAAPALLHTA
jgi:N-formylglutamate amidohydrolase